MSLNFIIDSCVVVIPLASVNASVSCMMNSVYRRASAPFVTYGVSNKWIYLPSACESIQKKFF